MEMIEQIVDAALAYDSLKLRGLIQQFLRTNPRFEELSMIRTNDATRLSLGAGIIELLAEQAGQTPPSWTKETEMLPEPMFLLQSASKMKRLRQLCLEESPLPLRKRGFYAPPNYLTFV